MSMSRPKTEFKIIGDFFTLKTEDFHYLYNIILPSVLIIFCFKRKLKLFHKIYGLETLQFSFKTEGY